MRYFVLLSVLLAGSAFAAPATPIVNSSTINYSFSPSQITINGSNFKPQTAAPTVQFNAVALTLISFSNTQVVAALPASTQPGTFSLKVTNSQGNSVEFDVTYGAVGPQGPIGPQGQTGSAGPAGPVGPTGPTGAQGAAGPVGPVGPAGPQGPSGAAGAPGPVGPPGLGMNYKGVWAAATTYKTNDSIFYNGSSYISLTNSNTGNEPDTDVANNVGNWALLAQQGATGSTGPQGLTGAMGPQGPQGAVGPQGPSGAPGAMGIPGPLGPEGLSGPTGPAGPAGPAGPSHVYISNIQSYQNIPLGALTQVSSLNLPGPATYFLSAKAVVAWGAPYFAYCFLNNPDGPSANALDVSSASFPFPTADPDGLSAFATLALQGTYTVTGSSATASVSCIDYPQAGSPSEIQIVNVVLSGIQVGGVN